VWRELLGAEPVAVPAYTPDWTEARREEALWEAAGRHLLPREAAEPGDVLLFRMRDGSVAKHLGIMTEGGQSPRFIHAYSGHGAWRLARRICAGSFDGDHRAGDRRDTGQRD
jgi:NlpC/P60 family putative phage cell wall peptidase